MDVRSDAPLLLIGAERSIANDVASKTQDQRLAFEASIRANAVSYSVQLFLGRGQFERAETDTLVEAITIGKAMQDAHPTCQAQPIYYAIEPSGHSTTITPAQFTESTNMIKSAVRTESAANVVNADALRRLKNAERMRASRAKAKAVAPSAQDKIAQVAEALGVEAPADLGFIRPPVEPSVEAAKKPTPAKAASKPAKAGPAPKATEKPSPPRKRRLASALTFWRPRSAARYPRRRISRPRPTRGSAASSPRSSASSRPATSPG